jgi:hypothetical protein
LFGYVGREKFWVYHENGSREQKFSAEAESPEAGIE